MTLVLRGSLHFDLLLGRCSNLVQRQGGGWLRELPNRNQAAQPDQRVHCNFHHVFVSLFRLNEQPVRRSLFHAVSFCCEDVAERCFCLNSLSVIVAFEHWMRGRVESDSK